MRLVARRAAKSGRAFEYNRSHVHGPTRATLKVVAQAWQGRIKNRTKGKRNQFPQQLRKHLDDGNCGLDGPDDNDDEASIDLDRLYSLELFVATVRICLFLFTLIESCCHRGW